MLRACESLESNPSRLRISHDCLSFEGCEGRPTIESSRKQRLHGQFRKREIHRQRSSPAWVVVQLYGRTGREVVILVLLLVVILSFMLGEGESRMAPLRQTFTGITTTFSGWTTAYTWTNEPSSPDSSPVLVLALIIIAVLAVVMIKFFVAKGKSTEVFCVECGTRNPSTNDFCGRCGRRLRSG